LRWNAECLGPHTEAAGLRRTTLPITSHSKWVTDLDHVLLMVGGDTPLIDVKPMCWHQAINSLTSRG
jgi:hypothetical protein